MATRYSASVVERTTSRCICDFQHISLDTNLIREPDVDLLLDESAAKSASEYASRIGFPLPLVKTMPFSGFYAMYGRILRAARNCTKDGLSRSLARWSTANAMSGRVFLARYWRPPTIELYSVLNCAEPCDLFGSMSRSIGEAADLHSASPCLSSSLRL